MRARSARRLRQRGGGGDRRRADDIAGGQRDLERGEVVGDHPDERIPIGSGTHDRVLRRQQRDGAPLGLLPCPESQGVPTDQHRAVGQFGSTVGDQRVPGLAQHLPRCPRLRIQRPRGFFGLLARRSGSSQRGVGVVDGGRELVDPGQLRLRVHLGGRTDERDGRVRPAGWSGRPGRPSPARERRSRPFRPDGWR